MAASSALRQQALADGDDTRASQGTHQLRAGLACLDEDLPAMITGRVYRAIGAGMIAGGGEDAGDEAEREHLRDSTNQLLTVSMVAAGLGLGSLTWGVILEGRGTLPAASLWREGHLGEVLVQTG